MLRWMGKFKGCPAIWNAGIIDQISALLAQYNKTLPHEIHRNFRSLKNICFWKGTEFRSVLLYAGIVLFKDFLPEIEYNLFLKLFCAVTICSTKTYAMFYPLARTIFIEYIDGFIDIYGEENVVINVHNLSHIVDDVEHLGDLTTISAYEFENSLYKMKLVLKQCNNPLQQLVRRLHENDLLRKPYTFDNDNFPKVMSQFMCPETSNRMAFAKIEFKSNAILCNDNKNKWFILKDNVIVHFVFAFKIGNDYFVRGHPLKEIRNFFNRPFDSKYLNVFISNCEFHDSQNYNVKEIKAKMFSIPYGREFVFLPLLHTL